MQVSAPFAVDQCNQNQSRPPLYKPAGVFPEDVFRCMTQEKTIKSNYSKAFKGRHDMAISRFDLEAAQEQPKMAGPSAKYFEENPENVKAAEKYEKAIEEYLLLKKVTRAEM